MPTVRILFSAPGLEIGTYRCLPGDRAWHVENSVGAGYHVVIPGPPVLIEQSRGRPVVANANHAIFYNAHEVYRRGLLSERGDACVFVRFEEEVLGAVAADIDPRLAGDGQFHFPFVAGPLDAATHLEHRLLVEHLAHAPEPDALLAEETVLRLVRATVAASLRVRGTARQPTRAATVAQHRDLVEDAKAVLSSRFAEPIGLHDIAASVYASPYHLARVFRSGTGSSLHAYRNQLRLRASLERLVEPRRHVAGIAHELGYASASQFTDSFRAAFAMSPSAFRGAAIGV